MSVGCGCNAINKRKCTCGANCGCKDIPLTTCSPCTTPLCPNGDPCPETFSAGCVVYTGDTIADLGIMKGQRLDSIIQLFALLSTNPGCAYPTSPCQSVLGVQSTNITSTTVSLKWLPVVVASGGYQVEYRATTAVSWTLNPIVAQSANPTDLIGGLTANTQYYIRVKSICASTCESLTILITTLTT